MLRLMSEGVDLMLACHHRVFSDDGRVPVMEMGFPSDRHHAFFERPTLGYNGYTGFIDRMAEAFSAARPRG